MDCQVNTVFGIDCIWLLISYYSIGKHYLKMRCFRSGLSGEYSIWCKLYIVVNFLLQHWEALFKDEVF